MYDGGKTRVFVSYSHGGKGPAWKEALLRELNVVGGHGLLDIWQDGEIRDGSLWSDDIVQAMGDAAVAILLITPEALRSDYILNTEFPFLRDRQISDGLRVFPVICEPCNWKAFDWLVATQASNSSVPLSLLSPDSQQDALHRIATGVAEELGRRALSDLDPDALGASKSRVRTYLDRFPLSRKGRRIKETLIGREQELALLDLAYAQPHAAIVSLVAWGGVGKTELVRSWLQQQQYRGWPGVQRVYGWSFYSQGTKQDRQSSDDAFLTHALEWFDIECEPTLSPWTKGRLLADAVSRQVTLLVLDGVEPLQYPPGPMGGRLRAPGLQSLLEKVANQARDDMHRGLCLVTTREPLVDLADFERRENAAWGSVLRMDLGNLTDKAGAAVLHQAGATRSGAAEIAADDPELRAASSEVGGHALTLNLLGRFLRRGYGRDVRRRDLVKFEEADCREQGGTTFRMLEAFERWFAKSDEFGARQLAVLRILGLFDRPADAGCLGALRKPPVIAGVTDPLFIIVSAPGADQDSLQPLAEEEWSVAISFLADFGLIDDRASSDGQLRSLDCHPLIREYFEAQLRKENPKGTRSAHARLYEYLRDTAELRPSTLDSLEPLYQAVFHGCHADMRQRVKDEVYFPRILRGAEHFTWHKHGAFGSEICALASFFDEPWSKPSTSLSEPTQAWFLNEAAFCLRMLGRLRESIEPLQLSVRMNEQQGRWADAVLCAGNLSELELTLGDVAAACRDAGRSVVYSDRAQVPFYRRRNRTLQAEALHCAGRRQQALALFRQAESLMSEDEPVSLLYGLLGYRYCDFLLAGAERAAWLRSLDVEFETGNAIDEAVCEVARRAHKMFEWRESDDSLLEIGLDHLTLGRVSLYTWVLDSSAMVARELAISQIQAATEALHTAGQQEFMVSSLLVRSWLNGLEGSPSHASADLDDAWRIAQRGSMRLFMADVHLHRARLFRDGNELRKARALIESCGYWRRREELEDAEKASLAWTN